MRAKDIMLAIAVPFLWGSNFVAVKLAILDFSPMFLVALRFALVAALMLPFVNAPSLRQVPAVVAVSMTLCGLHFGLMFTGLERITASTAAIANQLGVPFSALLAVALFGDRLGWRRFVGIVIAFGGVVTLAGAPDVAGDLLGLALVIGAALAWAIANIIIKHNGPFNPYMLTAWTALLAVPQLALVSIWTEEGQLQSIMTATWVSWTSIAYSVVGSSIFAYTIWSNLLNKNQVSHIVPFTLLVPVFAVISAVLILNEPLTWLLVTGGLITICGVGLCEIDFRRKKLNSH